MSIDKAYILAAGLGTRMGEKGKNLPKPLWPVFDKYLIELQLRFALSLQIKKIIINLFHQKELLKKTLESEGIQKLLKTHHAQLILIEEPTLLGVGGSIHNLQTVNELKGTIIILNADQFLFFSPHHWRKAWEMVKSPGSVVLFPIELSAAEKNDYNTLSIDHHRLLKGIIPQKTSSLLPPWITYSGVALINLDNLAYQAGPSGFFDTVANFRTRDIHVYPLQKNENSFNYEYWDFGTLERYQQSIQKLLMKPQHSLFYQWLCDNQAIIPENILEQEATSYQGRLAHYQMGSELKIDFLI
jgi:NDP-sugar pyrophosphorylase family protein